MVREDVPGEPRRALQRVLPKPRRDLEALEKYPTSTSFRRRSEYPLADAPDHAGERLADHAAPACRRPRRCSIRSTSSSACCCMIGITDPEKAMKDPERPAGPAAARPGDRSPPGHPLQAKQLDVRSKQQENQRKAASRERSEAQHQGQATRHGDAGRRRRSRRIPATQAYHRRAEGADRARSGCKPSRNLPAQRETEKAHVDTQLQVRKAHLDAHKAESHTQIRGAPIARNHVRPTCTTPT